MSNAFVYVSYIYTTPQKVWDAVTSAEFTKQYFGVPLISDWKPGSPWRMVYVAGNMNPSMFTCRPNPAGARAARTALR